MVQFYQIMKQQSGSQCNPQLNRLKLIQQNIKLNTEIKILQQKMSTVIAMDITREVELDKKKNQAKPHLNEFSMQEAYIKNLKTKIKQLKALNLSDINRGIINEENQLVVMKKEYEKLCEQKRVLNSKCQDKKTALQYNAPLNEYKSQTESELTRIKKKNADYLARIVQMERQARKYHKYQQMHKHLKNQKIVLENPEYQFAKIDHEKLNINKKTRLIQQKWKPQIEALDKEYFQNKQIFNSKTSIVNELQKELKNWQNRASAVRNQSDVLQDRDRLAKVVTMSPLKKQSLQKSKTPQKNEKKQDASVVDFFKNLFSKNTNQKQKQVQKIVKPQINVSQQLREEKQDVRKWNNLAVETRYGTKSEKVKQSENFKQSFTKLSQKNQFMKSKHSFEEFDLKKLKKKPEEQLQEKKNKILTNSVAVGTSFYYNDDD